VAEYIYGTPTIPAPPPVLSIGSNTPFTKLRMERLVMPSKYLLPPYSWIVSTQEQDLLYEQLIKHHMSSKESKIKEYVQLPSFFNHFF
jgi:hypothetical protein